MKRKVVVTGMGLATPFGLDVEENWSKALSGMSGITRLEVPGAEKSPIQAAGQVSERDFARICREFPEQSKNEAERKALFALWAAKSALQDSGWEKAPGNGNRSGVMLAAGLGINRLEDIHRWLGDGEKFDGARFGAECAEIHRESIVRNNSNRQAALLSRTFGFSGLNATVSTACASSTQALGLAFRAIRRGEADVMLAGGADSMFDPVGLVFFVLLRSAALSSADPQLACRPFDRKRTGLVMGEGAGIAVLEEESHALKRGARIYAEVAGYASSLDAYRLTAPPPEGEGAELSMRKAIEDAGLTPESIDYINAHGTSTKLNDISETIAIKRLFGENAHRVAVNATKSLTGHVLAASGGPELIFTVLSVQRDQVHPTLNLTHQDPKCDLDYVPGVMRSMRVRAALSNSFGFGGQNATIVVKKYGG